MDIDDKYKHCVTIDYTNWRGERRKRVVFPVGIYFGWNEWHKTPQWLLIALDLENNAARREFATANIHGEWVPYDPNPIVDAFTGRRKNDPKPPPVGAILRTSGDRRFDYSHRPAGHIAGDKIGDTEGFPGTDEGSHFMSQTRVEAPARTTTRPPSSERFQFRDTWQEKWALAVKCPACDAEAHKACDIQTGHDLWRANANDNMWTRTHHLRINAGIRHREEQE